MEQEVSFIRIKVRNIPAAIFKALNGFATSGINVVYISSTNEIPFDHLNEIIIGFEGSYLDETNEFVKTALDELDYFTQSMELLGVTEEGKGFPVEIQVQRSELSRNSVSLAAAYLHDQISLALIALEENKPNDDEGYQSYEKLVEFYEATLSHMGKVISSEDNESGRKLVLHESQELSKRVQDMARRVSSSKRMQSLVDTSLIGGCYAFLAMCGLPTAIAASTAVATFAGPKLLETIKKLLNSQKKQT